MFTDGKPDFESVMERYLASPKKISQVAARKPAVYIVWDILWRDRSQITHLPLMERKEILDQVLENANFIRKMEWIEVEGLALWEAVKSHNLEGMVAKKKNSQYIFRRSSSWLKIKNYQQAVINVLGYSKKNGAVLVGTDGKVQGHAIGMQEPDRKILWQILDNYGQVKGSNIYLPLGVRGTVKFTTWTPKGNMRDCSWVGFEV